MPVPTRRLAVAVAAGAVAQIVVALVADDLAPLMLAGWMLFWLGLAVQDFVSAPDPNMIGFDRELPPVTTLGGEARVRWIVSNPLDRSLRVGVSDQFAPSLQATTRRATLDIPPRSTAEVEILMHPTRRGRFRPSEVVIRTEGRLGLSARQSTRILPGEIRVHPAFPSRKEAEIRINRARLLHVGVRSARLRGSGTEFDQLRDYTVDDESNRVDWAATARAGRLIVRTFRAERNQTVVNLLDSGRVMAGRVAGVPRLEHAMDAVMALTAVSTGIGDRCGLVVFDRSVHTVLAASNRQSQLGAVTSALFEIEPALVESDYMSAFASTLGRFRRRTMLVIHTDLVEQVVAETLLPALPLVLKKHLVVVAAVIDPDVVNWTNSEVIDGHEARRRAGAVASLRERRRAADRLRSMGATVIDAPVGELPGRLADAYLNVKATGRL